MFHRWSSAAAKPWRLPLRRVNTEAAPWVYRHVVLRAAHVLIPLFVRRHWSGQENIPREGGVLIVANHICNLDPIVVGEFLVYSGRWTRFLGKAEIWRWPVAGWIARASDQIPVHRDTEQARDSLIHARRALDDGLAVLIFPEGTTSLDPEHWPMHGRRGAAQLALETGVPVVPLVQWGAHEISGARETEWRRLLGGRRDVQIHAGPPVDLSAYAARLPDVGPPPKELLDEVTAHLIDTLTHMLADLRGETPPQDRWDMRAGRRVAKLDG